MSTNVYDCRHAPMALVLVTFALISEMARPAALLALVALSGGEPLRVAIRVCAQSTLLVGAMSYVAAAIVGLPVLALIVDAISGVIALYWITSLHNVRATPEHNRP